MMSTETKEVKKRRGTSVPLLVAFLIIGGLGYLYGEKLMTYAFFLQESMIAGSGAQGGDVPKGITPDISGDPNSGPGPGAMGPSGDGPGGSGSSTAPLDVADPPVEPAAPETPAEPVEPDTAQN